jgi:hypothetical protein
LARSGNHTQAAAVTRAEATAPTIEPDDLIWAARALAVAAEVVRTDPDLKGRYSADAIKLLEAAIQKGCSDTSSLEAEADFDALREREDFKQIVLKLAERAKVKEE